MILKDSTVVAPGYLILPDNMVTPIPTGGTTTGGGEKILPDGRVELADGTVISAEGIRTPDGAVLSPEKPYQIAAGGRRPAPTPTGRPVRRAAGPGRQCGLAALAARRPGERPPPRARAATARPPLRRRRRAPHPAWNPPPRPACPPDSSEPEDDDKGVLEAQQSAAGGWSSWEE